MELGEDLKERGDEIKSRLGYLSQDFSLYSDLTVEENMAFFAEIHQISDFSRRRQELLSFTRMTPFRNRKAGALSGGMKKKLALACSLVHEPEVVLLDEPTLGVDPVSRREFWNLLGSLRAEKGLTIFVCTPYMDEAERCNYVGLMYQGRLIARNCPAEIKKMVPGRLLEFAPSHFVPATRLVSEMEGVLELQTYGAMLHVFVDDPPRRQGEIEARLAGEGITCQGMREIEPRMEEAFISLIRREAAGR